MAMRNVAAVARVVQVVADYGPDDLAHAELLQLLALAVPDGVVHLTPVDDTLAAGFCVARLALGHGPPDRVVAHDVGADGAADDRLWAGCTRGGVWIVGPNTGFSWSFVVGELRALFRLDVSAGTCRLRPRDGLPAAVAHVTRRHSHALEDAAPRSSVPALPARVVAYVDATGDIRTTIAELPGAVGARVQVRIGKVSAQAIVAGSDQPVPRGLLALAPGGGPQGFVDLVLGAGSAAERFAQPPPGTAIRLRPDAVRSAGADREL